MKFEKAEAEVIYFTNRDVSTASGDGDGGAAGCRVPGWDRGNSCANNRSSDCPSQAWME